MAGCRFKIAKIYFEYSVFMLLAGVLRFLPLFIAIRVGVLFARLFCMATRRSSVFIEQQMRASFGVRFSDSEYKNLVKKFYYHFGCLFVETVRIKTLTKENIDDFLDLKGLKVELGLLAEKYGKGAFFATGHIGNWEFTGAAGALKGILAGSIARPLDNPLIDKKVKEFREFSGQKIWDKEGALLNILRAIKNKKSVGILIDQDAGEQGLRVPFLGRPASTGVAIAEMALRTGAPILPIALQRVEGKPMFFKINIGEAIIPNKLEQTAAERLRILTAINNELSKIIMDAPEQWLWTHKRWKTPNPMDRRFLSRYE